MKIVFIGGRDIHKLGGIENYMYNLATQLAKAGHTPIVCCESDRNDVEIVNGFEVRYFMGPKSNLLCKPLVGLKATLHFVFKEKDVDLIHYNAWPPSLWSWIPRMKGIPSLMEGHGLEWKRSKYSSLSRRILKFMECVTAHLNQNLIMCSKSQVNYFRARYGRDSVCIPTAVNLPETVNETDILKRFNLAEKKYFLFMGRLVQDKNPDCLIKAFAKISRNGFKLVIAGSNDALPDYVAMLHSLASGNSDVVFTGAVYGDDKATLLKNAYCFCLPSTIEGLSIVLLEAMSYRLPVIASDIDANKEVLDDNKALWVKPEAIEDLACAMENALADKEKLDKFVEYNYNLVASDYTWDKVAGKYMSYISSIV